MALITWKPDGTITIDDETHGNEDLVHPAIAERNKLKNALRILLSGARLEDGAYKLTVSTQDMDHLRMLSL